MTAKEDILFEELRLLVHIENQIVKTIQKFCQWRLTRYIFQEISDEEQQILLKYQEEVLENIKKLAPLHYEYVHMHPLSTVFNDCNWNYFQHDYEKWIKDVDQNVCYWATITYNDFEEAGFSKDFSKRVVEKLVDEGKIIRKRGIYGYKFTVKQIEDIKDRIKFSRQCVQLTQSNLEDFYNIDWMFDRYSDEALMERFIPIRNYVVKNIENGLEFKDEVNPA